jgi:hypothetical protein
VSAECQPSAYCLLYDPAFKSQPSASRVLIVCCMTLHGLYYAVLCSEGLCPHQHVMLCVCCGISFSVVIPFLWAVLQMSVEQVGRLADVSGTGGGLISHSFPGRAPQAWWLWSLWRLSRSGPMSQAKYLYCFIDTDKRSLFIKNRPIHTISSVRQQHIHTCIQQKHFEHF